jgi:hypothetical protein
MFLIVSKLIPADPLRVRDKSGEAGMQAQIAESFLGDAANSFAARQSGRMICTGAPVAKRSLCHRPWPVPVLERRLYYCGPHGPNVLTKLLSARADQPHS